MAPILMYHEVVPDADNPQALGLDPVYACSRSAFEQQMAYLYDHGFRTLRLNDLLGMHSEACKTETNAVVITFDDGHRSQWSEAVPILKRYGFTAEFFLAVEWIGQPGYMDWDDVKALDQAGMGIGSHGYHHRFLDDLSQPEAASEVIESKRALEARLGHSVFFFAPPGGRLHPTTAQHARQAGYAGLCTSVPGWVSEEMNPYALPRVAIKNGLSMEAFQQIVQCDAAMFLQLSRQARLLRAAKRIMGNAWYERARSAWFRTVGLGRRSRLV